MPGDYLPVMLSTLNRFGFGYPGFRVAASILAQW
jgi:hypothetical protein